MFAVPGWNISASDLKTGTNANPKAPGAQATQQQDKPTSTEQSAETAKDRKKKKKNKKTTNGIKITADNLAEVYEKIIEKKEEGTDSKAANGKKRKHEEGVGQEQGSPQKKKKTLKEKKREKKARAAESSGQPAQPAAPSTATLAVVQAAPTPASTVKLTPLQQKMREKLTSARFRHINELLYTTPSESALKKFQEEPSLFDEYHVGFRRQVEVWPENPVDVFLDTLKERAKLRYEKGDRRRRMGGGVEGKDLPLPRDDNLVCTVADLGCGDAKIAQTIMGSELGFKSGKNAKNKGKIRVLSYDLKSVNPLVTAADIAHLPLESETVDVAIFCLALMGTNFLDFIEEAFRVLRWGGELWIAEIKSRFQNPGEHKKKNNPDGELLNKGKIGVRKPGKDDADMEDVSGGAEAGAWNGFIEALSRRGFTLRGNVDASNKMFVRMEFVKADKREWKKNAEDSEEEDEKPQRGGKMKKSKLKFLEETEEQIRKRESTLLKPCVYKLR